MKKQVTEGKSTECMKHGQRNMYKTYAAREEVATHRKAVIMKWMNRDTKALGVTTACESALDNLWSVD